MLSIYERSCGHRKRDGAFLSFLYVWLRPRNGSLPLPRGVRSQRLLDTDRYELKISYTVGMERL